MEQNQNVVTERTKILFTHLSNITEVIDMYEEVQSIDFGVIDTLNEHTDFISEIQNNLQAEIFSIDDQELHDCLTNASIYFSNVLNMIDAKLSGMSSVADAEGENSAKKHNLKLGRNQVITDDLLKEYIEKAVGCYLVFLSNLCNALDESELKAVADEKHLKMYKEFKEALDTHNDLIEKYFNFDFEKEENLHIIDRVDDDGNPIAFTPEEQAEMDNRVVEALNWNSFVNQG